MSDTMTSGEIEDVLSSIRRLVTEELKPHPRVQAVVAAREADKLILTPALRVVDAPTVLVLEPAAPETEPLAEPVPEGAARLDGVVASICAAVTGLPEAWESETGDDAVTRVAFASTRPRGAAFEEAPDPWEDARAGEIEAVATPEAEVADEDAPRVGEADPAHADPEAAFIHRTAMDRAEAAARAEIEAAAREVPEEAVEWADTRDEVRAAFTVEADDSMPDAPELDEAMLRDMIRDVLREELQGPLGERITRNIRKLVRAEVHRAIDTQRFD